MKYFVLASLLCLSACGDDNDNKNNETPQNLAELTVDASEISIAQGDTRTVKITSGNGEYEVTSANEEVVTAEVDGDIVTLTAVEGHNNAQGVVYVKDKYYQRAKILVNTAAEFDLKLNKTLFTLYSQVEGADEAFVKIYTGNGGYSLEVIDENNCIEVDQSTLEDSESFTVKGIAQGNAEVKITDRKGKEAFVNLNVIAPKQITTDADEKGVLINANQGSQQVKILSGNGEYKILDAGDTKVVRLELYGNVVTVTGRKAGETSFTLTDAKGQVSQPIQVKIAPDKRWCMNLGRDYAVWTHFGEMTGEGVEALKAATNDFKLKKMTWELTCRIDNTYWLQTIMGKEGYFILRGGDDGEKGKEGGNQWKVIDLVGTGDKLQLRTGHNAIKLGEWMHLALVVDYDVAQSNPSEKYKLYINGSRVAWGEIKRNDLNFSEIDLCAGNDGGKVSIGKASDNNRFLGGAVLEARIWSVCRTEAQLKANAWDFVEENPEGLLGRWDFSAGAPVAYIEDGTDSDHELLMHVCKYDSFNATEFPMSRFGEAPIEVPFK
ncbi:LamG-like jellyroll fold domain-containing protein [Bacteroides thetaiotaomicron]|uniref:LamG-like jellyroll fold domain-containing protein n=1 Tax=Bacteroides thetaiotaomicron TaxID=818 RepID=UPI0028698646|nr:LamG-like jellyroll fold domain-containing protein [Bacteroides thetaiotaomicron]